MKTDVNPWDQRYGSDTYYYGPEPNAFLHEHLAAIRRGSEGRNAVFLAEQGYAVVAVDQSQAGLKKTERLAASKDVRFTTVHADFTDYKTPRVYKSVIARLHDLSSSQSADTRGRRRPGPPAESLGSIWQ
jgi:hypothetical protein